MRESHRLAHAREPQFPVNALRWDLPQYLHPERHAKHQFLQLHLDPASHIQERPVAECRLWAACEDQILVDVHPQTRRLDRMQPRPIGTRMLLLARQSKVRPKFCHRNRRAPLLVEQTLWSGWLRQQTNLQHRLQRAVLPAFLDPE